MSEKARRAPPPAAESIVDRMVDADVYAFKAVSTGEATPEQQIRCLKMIIEDICGYYDLSYRPGDTHETAFYEGRRFCGAQIVGATKKKLKRETH